MSGIYSFIGVSASLTSPTGSTDLGHGSANSEGGITVVVTETESTITVNADDEVMHNLHVGKSGTIAVTLLKTSPVNKRLSLMYNAQSLSSATWGGNVIIIHNKVSGDTITAHSCALQKQPSHANAKVGNMVSQAFDCGKIDQLLREF